MAELSLTDFIGINNRRNDYRITPTKQEPRRHVADAVNVDFYEDGLFRTRCGLDRLSSFVDGTALVEVGGKALLLRGGELGVITSLVPLTVAVVRTGLTGTTLSAEALGADIWWSDGVVSGRVGVGNTDAPWIPPAPPAAVVLGDGPKTFISWLNAAGEESTLSVAQVSGGDVVLPAPSAGITHTNVYALGEHGGLFLQGTFAAAAGTAAAGALSPGVLVDNIEVAMVPTPPGEIVAMHNGRLLSASGPLLRASAPYRYGAYDPIGGVIGFPADISVVVPLDNGVIVVADKTYWLAGPDILAAEVAPKTDDRAVPGTAFRYAKGETQLAGWYGESGVILVEQNGGLTPITDAAFSAPQADRGTCYVQRRDGSTHLIVSLDDTAAYGQNVTPSFARYLADNPDASTLSVNLGNGAVSRYIGWSLLGMAQVGDTCAALDATGVAEVVDTPTDYGVEVPWAVGLGQVRTGRIFRTGAAYITCTTTNRIYLRVDTAAGASFSYPTRSLYAHRSVLRFDTGLGVRDNQMWFWLVGEGASEVEDALLLLPESTRRI